MQSNDLLAKLKFLSGVLKQPDNSETDKRLGHLSTLIDEIIPSTLKENSPPNFYELHKNFKALYSQFRNFVLYDELIGKNVVALGGGFSSGKSSFLNALDNEWAMPTAVNPSTAIPTFVVNGIEHKAFGINVFDAKISVEWRDIPKISYGFGDVLDDEGKKIVEPVMLGHIINSIFLSSPKQTYTNLAFVDTPGFSKPDSDTYSVKTDEDISRSQLDTSSYILLFVQSDAGTLKEEDIRFFQSLKPEIPKLFIVSKADKKDESELKKIVAQIKSQLTMKGIAYIDVLTFSSNKPKEYDAKAIREILSKWDKTQQTPQFSRNFKKLFIRCREHYENNIEEQRRNLERLNISLTKVNSDDDEAIAPLRDLVTESRAKVESLIKTKEKLTELNREFFTELKRVCNKIGVDMPEPSEADMYDDIPDALDILRKYKKEKGIKNNRNIHGMLKETFSGIVPVLDNTTGGSVHRDAMVRLIQENCRVDVENIHINDAAAVAEVFKYEIQNLIKVFEQIAEVKS